jgi:glucose-6-phosphate 1-epimerase
MEVVRTKDEVGNPLYKLGSGDSEVVVAGFGGQILSWVKAGVPIVFENRGLAIVDGKTSYRGGAPICFPYFAKGSLLPLGTELSPMHGRARTSVWDQVSKDGSGELALRTVQPSGDGYGPTTFSCELSFALSDSLVLEATVQNLGSVEAPFQLAVHTYWATAEPAKATIIGFGNRYLDNILGMSEHYEEDSSVPHLAPVDRVYVDAAPHLELSTEAYRLEITTAGCSGAVLWNPGPDHGLKDLGSPDFICLESGQIVPGKVLAPGDQHRIEIDYRAHV